MSLINQMLKDLEDRQETPIKGQDSIISPNRAKPAVNHTPLILLSLVSLALLATIAYLLWSPYSSQSVESPINNRVETGNSEAAILSSQRKTAENPLPVVEPEKTTQPAPTKRVEVKPQPRNKVNLAPLANNGTPKTKPDLIAKEKPVAVSIKRLVPSTLTGSWQPQTLAIMGENFYPNSRILICWPERCVTLKGERINYISSNKLTVALTTGIQKARWHLTVLNPDGGASNAHDFHVVGSTRVTSDFAKPALIDPPPQEAPYSERDSSISKRLIPLSAYQQAEAYYLEGKQHEQAGAEQQAITLWERAILLAPEHHASRQALIDMLIRSARTVEAKGHIHQAIKLFPDRPVYIQKLAQIYISQDESSKAITLIEGAIQQGVANAELYAFIAALYQRDNHSQKSIEHYQRALSLNRNSAIWWMGLGISLEQDGQLTEALSAFEQAQNGSTLSTRLSRYVEGKMAFINDKLAD